MTGEELRDALVVAGVPAELIETTDGTGAPIGDGRTVVIDFGEDAGAVSVVCAQDVLSWIAYDARLDVLPDYSGQAFPISAGIAVVARYVVDAVTGNK